METYLRIFLHDCLDQIRQDSAVEVFYQQFEAIRSLVSLSQPWLPEIYFADRFVYGLHEDIQGYVISCKPVTVIDAFHLACIYESTFRPAYLVESRHTYDEETFKFVTSLDLSINDVWRNIIICLHDALDDLQQLSSLDEYYHQFQALRSLVTSIEPWIPESYFTDRFIYGLCEEIQPYVIQINPCRIIDAYHLAAVYQYSRLPTDGSYVVLDTFKVDADSQSRSGNGENSLIVPKMSLEYVVEVVDEEPSSQIYTHENTELELVSDAHCRENHEEFELRGKVDLSKVQIQNSEYLTLQVSQEAYGNDDVLEHISSLLRTNVIVSASLDFAAKIEVPIAWSLHSKVHKSVGAFGSYSADMGTVTMQSSLIVDVCKWRWQNLLDYRDRWHLSLVVDFQCPSPILAFFHKLFGCYSLIVQHLTFTWEPGTAQWEMIVSSREGVKDLSSIDNRICKFVSKLHSSPMEVYLVRKFNCICQNNKLSQDQFSVMFVGIDLWSSNGDFLGFDSVRQIMIPGSPYFWGASAQWPDINGVTLDRLAIQGDLFHTLFVYLPTVSKDLNISYFCTEVKDLMAAWIYCIYGCYSVLRSTGASTELYKDHMVYVNTASSSFSGLSFKVQLYNSRSAVLYPYFICFDPGITSIWLYARKFVCALYHFYISGTRYDKSEMLLALATKCIERGIFREGRSVVLIATVSERCNVISECGVETQEILGRPCSLHDYILDPGIISITRSSYQRSFHFVFDPGVAITLFIRGWYNHLHNPQHIAHMSFNLVSAFQRVDYYTTRTSNAMCLLHNSGGHSLIVRGEIDVELWLVSQVTVCVNQMNLVGESGIFPSSPCKQSFYVAFLGNSNGTYLQTNFSAATHTWITTVLQKDGSYAQCAELVVSSSIFPAISVSLSAVLEWRIAWIVRSSALLYYSGLNLDSNGLLLQGHSIFLVVASYCDEPMCTSKENDLFDASSKVYISLGFNWAFTDVVEDFQTVFCPFRDKSSSFRMHLFVYDPGISDSTYIYTAILVIATMGNLLHKVISLLLCATRICSNKGYDCFKGTAYLICIFHYEHGIELLFVYCDNVQHGMMVTGGDMVLSSTGTTSGTFSDAKYVHYQVLVCSGFQLLKFCGLFLVGDGTLVELMWRIAWFLTNYATSTTDHCMTPMERLALFVF